MQNFGMHRQGSSLKDRNESLVHFIRIGDLKQVERLLDQGADPNCTRTNDRHSALHYAALNNYPAILLLLLKRGAKVDQINAMRQTALHWAAERGHLQIVKLLAAADCNLEALTDFNESALHVAARFKKKAVVQFLVEQGVDVDVVNKDNKTPLHAAADSDDPAVAQVLLDSGCDPTPLDYYNATPLALSMNRTNSQSRLVIENRGGVESPKLRNARQPPRQVQRTLAKSQSFVD